MHLACYGVRLQIQFTSAITQQSFLGYALRGLLGRALFNAVCIYPQAQCTQCILRESCAYPQLFKPSELNSAQTRLPGYVIHDWSLTENRCSLHMTLLVFGSAVRYLEITLKSLMRIDGHIQLLGARQGRIIHMLDVGSERQLLHPNQRAKVMPIKIMPNYTSQLSICLQTPLATKHQQQDFLFAALRTRLRRLLVDYGQGDWSREVPVWKVINQQLHTTRITVNARRQLSGVLGTLYLDEISPEAFRLLSLGQYIHAGADAVAGMGKLVLNTVTD